VTIRNPASATLCVAWWLGTAIGSSAMLPARAQDQPASPPAPPAERDDDEKMKGQDPGGSLDDLLGLEETEEQRTAREAAEAEAEAALQRALEEERISDAFKDAVRQMALSASLLGEKFDAGIGTQRIQEDILRKLDQLIESARKQQSNSSSSSSSSSQQQQQQQQSRPQQQNQASQNQTNPQAASNENPDDSGVFPPEDARNIGTMLEETDVEWGSLPARVRDQLLQSMRDRPSALYRKLTQEYYRRLAEESTR